MSAIEVVLADELWQDVEPGTEALLEEWLVAEGETVRPGQSLAIVVLVKTSHEVTATQAGVLERILVPAESTFARAAPLALVREGA